MSTIYLRDLSSGRVHKAERDDETGVIRTAEGCNLDDAGEREEITSIDDVDPGALCDRDFPGERVAD